MHGSESGRNWLNFVTGSLPFNPLSTADYPTSHVGSLPGDSRFPAFLCFQGGAPGGAAAFILNVVVFSICLHVSVLPSLCHSDTH
jgi:hypothetical protein